MSEHDALFRAVLDNPDDDAVRLVYADWQEEHGDVNYAQFIRAQVATAGAPEWEPAGLRARRLPGSVGFPKDFRPPEPPLPEGLTWLGGAHRRGFPAAVYCRGVEALLRHADELFAAAPVEELEIVAESSRVFSSLDLSAPVAAPWFSRIRRLELALGTLDAASITRMQESPHAANLTHLNVETCRLSPDALEELFRPPLIGRLRHLAVHVREYPADFTALVRAAGGPHRMRSLVLRAGSNNEPPPPTFGAGLLDCPLFRGLEELDVASNALGPDGVRGLVGSAAVAGLRSLSVGWPPIGPEGVRVLVGSPSLGALRRLYLGGCDLTSDVAVAVAESPHLAGLRVLALDHNKLDDDAAVRVAGSPHLRGLLDLDLGFNELGDPGAAALIDSPLAGTLIHLQLMMNRISGPMKRKLRRCFGERVVY